MNRSRRGGLFVFPDDRQPDQPLAEVEANSQFHLAKPFKFGEFMDAVRERISQAECGGRN